MEQFINNQSSHEHSRFVLDLIYTYDSFLDSIQTICDMGCGAGLDACWWAKLETRDEPQEPRNYRVFAVDKEKRLDSSANDIDNLFFIQGDFENISLPTKVDLIWCHDALQYSVNPISTLSRWNNLMNDNGMLMLTVPSYSGTLNGKLTHRAYNHALQNYNIVGLVHHLALCGFDCRDAYFYQEGNWLYAAVYKMKPPYDPTKTKLYDLIEDGMLADSAIASIEKYGHLRQEDLVYPWLDKNFYQYR